MGGQRRSELVEQERSYKLVTKEKKESGKLVKQTLRFLFSQVGLIVLGIFTATLGEFLNTSKVLVVRQKMKYKRTTLLFRN